MSDVTAILVGPAQAAGPDGAAATLAVPGLHAVTQAARDAGTDLVWLLDAAAVPEAGALEALRPHAGAPAASLPVDARGRPVEALLGGVAHEDVALMVAELEHRRVPLRHTPVVSLLVPRELVASAAPPRPERFGRHAGTEWTARLFAEQPGVLVPDSRVRVEPHARAHLRHTIRLARDGVWSRGDVARELRRTLERSR
jgi:hypothetical protein